MVIHNIVCLWWMCVCLCVKQNMVDRSIKQLSGDGMG